MGRQPTDLMDAGERRGTETVVILRLLDGREVGRREVRGAGAWRWLCEMCGRNRENPPVWRT